MHYIMITNNPDIAQFVERFGVHKILIDQEVLGKQERQGHLNTHKAMHNNDDVRALSSVLKLAELMVRVNPLNNKSKMEIDEAISAGAQRLMLPMFRCEADVRKFKNLVAGRVPITLLAETASSLKTMQNWLPLVDRLYDEVHIGLNDLALDLNMPFLFEPLARGLLEEPADILNKSNIRWGFGGVARIGMGELPADKILGEHMRLGSSRVILSRAFHQEASSLDELLRLLDFPRELGKLREKEAYWGEASLLEIESNKVEVAETVIKISESKR